MGDCFVPHTKGTWEGYEQYVLLAFMAKIWQVWLLLRMHRGTWTFYDRLLEWFMSVVMNLTAQKQFIVHSFNIPMGRNYCALSPFMTGCWNGWLLEMGLPCQVCSHCPYWALKQPIVDRMGSVCEWTSCSREQLAQSWPGMQYIATKDGCTMSRRDRMWAWLKLQTSQCCFTGV